MDLGTVRGRFEALSQGQTVLVDKLYRIRDKTAQTPAYSEHYTLFSLGQTVEKSQGCQEKVSLAREVPRYHVEYSESGGGLIIYVIRATLLVETLVFMILRKCSYSS